MLGGVCVLHSRSNRFDCMHIQQVALTACMRGLRTGHAVIRSLWMHGSMDTV
jgi:hypothetical protein